MPRPVNQSRPRTAEDRYVRLWTRLHAAAADDRILNTTNVALAFRRIADSAGGDVAVRDSSSLIARAIGNRRRRIVVPMSSNVTDLSLRSLLSKLRRLADDGKWN